MAEFSFKGTNLHYHEAGRGPLLLIFCGNTAGGASHIEDLEYFSRWFHTVALDPPGTGQSGRLDTWPDDWWQQTAGAGAELIRHLNIESAFVMGVSGGGASALWLALKNLNLAKALVVDSYVDYWPGDMLRQAVAQRKNPDPMLKAFWQAAHGHDWDQVVARDSELLSRFFDAGLKIMGKGLAQIKAPVLFTLSEKDTDLAHPLEQLKEMTSLMPNARMEVFEEGSHPSIWTCPDLFRPLARDFLLAHSV